MDVYSNTSFDQFPIIMAILVILFAIIPFVILVFLGGLNSFSNLKYIRLLLDKAEFGDLKAVFLYFDLVSGCICLLCFVG